MMLGVAVSSAVLLPAQPAQAADALAPFTTNARLTRIDDDTSQLIASAEAAGVARASLAEVLDSRRGSAGLCHDTGLNRGLSVDGLCWDQQDDLSSYGDAGGGWMPQGFTASHAATADGLYQGRHLFAASWYFGKYNNGPNEQYTRVTIGQSDNGQVTYGHIALVEPVSGGFKELSYLSHADGIAWYGDRLFVANGVELQVYDLNHLWRMDDTASSSTGRAGGRSSARYHRWALPLIARYSTYSAAAVDTRSGAFPGNNPRACGPSNGEVCLSSLSVDRSGAPSLVSVENRSGAGARIIHWPLATLTAGTPAQVAARPTAYTTPVTAVQGTATDGSNYYMSGACPADWPGGDKVYSCIHVAKPGEAPHVLTQSPWLTQGLSWDPGARRLWGLNEALKDNNGGRRVVFSVSPDAGQEAAGYGWMSNHNQPGSVCATPQSDGTTNGTPVTVWPCTGAESQRWSYSDGLIVNRASGKCLTPQANASGTDGAVLTLWTCNPSSDVQKFAPSAGAIANTYGKVVTPKGNSLASGTWLTLWTHATPTPAVQQWTVKGF